MKTFTPLQEKLLLAVALFGLLVPNGIFLYFSGVAPNLLPAAIANPIALVFMLEATVLMLFFAWLIRHRGLNRPGWIAFIVMSLAGSLVFSIPFFLYLHSRKEKTI